MDSRYAKYLLDKTRNDYNLIAEDFSSSRYSVWPELNILGQYVKEGEKILDLGCGNGRLIEIFKNKDIDYIGADNSEKLIGIAKKKYPNVKFQVADALNLPFPDNYFDKIFSIAVLHHVPSAGLRRRFVSEVKRVLKPGGLLILTVWSLWRKPDSLKLITKFTLFKIFVKSELDFKDILVPWQRKVERYIHCFTKNELKKLVAEGGFKIKRTGTFKRKETNNYNIFLIAEK